MSIPGSAADGRIGRRASRAALVVAVLAALAAAPAARAEDAPLSYTIEYSGTYGDHATDPAGELDTVTALQWSETLRASVAMDGTITAAPVELTVGGTVTAQHAHGPEHVCTVERGDAPLTRGAFIDLQPTG